MLVRNNEHEKTAEFKSSKIKIIVQSKEQKEKRKKSTAKKGASKEEAEKKNKKKEKKVRGLIRNMTCMGQESL